MNLYKPFEYVFYRIESFYNLIGVGGSYNQVSGLIATMQWLNIMFIGSIIGDIIGYEFEFLYYVPVYLGLFVFNLIHYKEKKVRVILDKYEGMGKNSWLGLAVILYILISCGLIYFVLT